MTHLKQTVADLEQRLQASLAERDELLQQRAATNEVLQVINASSGDLVPVFDAILERAMRLCDAKFGLLATYDGRQIRTVAARGVPPAFAEFRKNNPPDYGPGTGPARILAGERVVHIADLKSGDAYRAGDPNRRAVVDLGGARTVLLVPLLKNKSVLGYITIYRKEVRLYSDKQIALLQNFADQAMIAIENARLFKEAQDSTAEVSEALERQTATSEILRVISQSRTDVQPVFDAIVRTAVRLIRCDIAFVFRCDGATFSPAAAAGPDGPLPDLGPSHLPIDPGANFPSRAIVGKKNVHLPNWSLIDLPEHERQMQELIGVNSALFLPLLREAECIGVLALAGKQANIFGESEIALAESFRDQALIAIENVRLFNETKEALERQTATADILKVIASSPDDVQPVFDVIVESAVRLCGARMGRVYRYEGGIIHMVAGHGLSVPGQGKVQQVFPRAATDDTIAGQVMRSGRPYFVTDIECDQSVPELSRQMIVALGTRSQVTVPMLRSGNPIGAITVGWAHPAAYQDRQVTLLNTFADQAVIAIENVRLFNETREALERQTATGEVLGVISSSWTDVAPVFDVILRSATRLCAAERGIVYRYEGEFFQGVAAQGLSEEASAEFLSRAVRPGPQSGLGRMLAAKCLVQIADVTDEEAYRKGDPLRMRTVQLLGARTAMWMPLLKGAAVIGAFAIYRQEVKPFTDQQIALLKTFADQAVVAIENTRLFNETKEALERQTATADILKVIANSPTYVQPVFEAIAERSKRLVDALSTTVFGLEDGVMHLRAFTPTNPQADATLKAMFPAPLSNFSWSEAIGGGEIYRVVDTELEAEDLRELARLRGFRSMLFVPLLHNRKSIGVIAVTRVEPGPFVDHHVQLLETFADQAVIAIQNVRMFDEVQAKTRNLTESLQQQTAVGDVLKTISRSTFDLQPVLDTLVHTAARLCDAEMAFIMRREDDFYRAGAAVGFSSKYIEFLRNHPLKVDRGTITGRAVLERRTVHILDVAADPEYTLRSTTLAHQRTALCVPLLRENEPIGSIVLARQRVEPFTQKQIDLVTTFADQAVIAIENVRLFDELRHRTNDLSEALTYQTGSGNILRVIASSPTEVGPVLKAIVESACELCEAYDAVVLLKDGGNLRFSAHHGPIGINIEKWPISRNWAAGRAFLDRQPVHLRDVLSDEGAGFPDSKELSQYTGTAGVRSILAIPLLSENESIGTILLRRTEVHPFSDKQIALLQTFADQAVIAIGNVRLFDEVQARTQDLSESLEQQTATADVLQVISSSPGDLQPVFKSMLSNALRICEAQFGNLLLFDGTGLVPAELHNSPAAFVELFKGGHLIPGPNTALGRVIAGKQVVHVADVMAGAAYAERDPLRMVTIESLRARTLLAVPMLKDTELVGTIVIYRQEVRPFSDRQIELVTSFASQAVIAIENTRLLKELRQRTDDLSESLQQQTATAEVLKVISRSAFDLQAVFDTLISSAVELSGAFNGTICLREGDHYRYLATSGIQGDFRTFLLEHPPTPGCASAAGRVLLSGNVESIPDVLQDPDYTVPAYDMNNIRSVLGVPLLRNDRVEGALVLSRTAPGLFTSRQIELVQTFADQAVIAIENVRLFDEVQARTKELAASLEDLRTAQDRLVQTEKLASLGQLTAGIAHEIKNPLNFVNNFSAMSAELVDELDETLATAPLDQKMRGDVGELTQMLKSNLEKVVQHGKRADSIVKNMLLHSREGRGEQRPADINALLDESLNLAYHGARAEKPGFNITLQRDFDASAGAIELFPQEITRAFLNLISNGFYAASKRKAENGDADFEPILSAATKNLGSHVEIRIRDNGTGIPSEVKEKIFNPFFTTKPAGEGTGLGLSMSHDIIVKQHGGRIEVDTQPGQFTEFRIVLPRAGASLFKSGEHA